MCLRWARVAVTTSILFTFAKRFTRTMFTRRAVFSSATILYLGKTMGTRAVVLPRAPLRTINAWSCCKTTFGFARTIAWRKVWTIPVLATTFLVIIKLPARV